MPEYMINNIPVNFPFEPYDVQKAFMEKVIESLKTSTNAVLESPTGTGKTLSLLCSSLAWVLSKKAELQIQGEREKTQDNFNPQTSQITVEDILAKINEPARKKPGGGWGVPKIIYASRTHSQLTQAMKELKQTSYAFVRAVVLGSRDQLCIHPEVMKEQGNSNKVQMCKVRVQTKSCSFYSRVESKKDSPEFREQSVMDVEDLITTGRKLKVCPYYSSKELVDNADITFMPYNYLLDPKARKANKVNLDNTIVILDEAHNVESLCEESASVMIKSSDIALAIDDVTHIMKAMSEDLLGEVSEEPRDFTLDDLALLKEMLLSLEKAVDEIQVPNKTEGATFPPSFMFEILEKGNITITSANMVVSLLERLLQFLAVASQNTMFRKGAGFEVLRDLISVVHFNKDENLGKIHKSFKVHVQLEEIKPQKFGAGKAAKGDGWLTTKLPASTKNAKIINYWCFNPGFGMEQLLNKNVRSIILTSGTLAPLKPLIAELAIPIQQTLENPHIVGKSQVCVKIVSYGPDKELLISNYQNRDNPKYVNSLGRTILSFCPIIPDGLLVFFPSYPLMNKCVDSWQASGIWSQIARHKPIFVEPRSKEAFNTAMIEFYEKIRDPSTKGAIFMAVCRGKVSEGLDFADTNGRAVIITGLPFPPLKDPRVILKKRYLDENRTKENELLNGNAWYSLEATRAVNQAIGRVIRHRNDYGAILLCDSRFNQPGQISQLSAWIREHLKGSQQHQSFGPVIGELSRFFRNAEKTLPKASIRSVESIVTETMDDPVVKVKQFSDPALVLESKMKFQSAHFAAIKIENTNTITSWTPEDYSKAIGKPRSSGIPSASDFISRLDSDITTIDFNASNLKTEDSSLVTIHKRERTSPSQTQTNSDPKKKRLKMVPNNPISSSTSSNFSNPSLHSLYAFNKPSITKNEEKTQELPTQHVDLLKLIKSSLTSENYSKFVKALMSYKKESSVTDLLAILTDVFGSPSMHYLLKGMRRFVKDQDKVKFDSTIERIVG
ncbi:regulator of telomere elongation helicase 1 homolog [Episyrphus balteatus]|uniref:regulator of telomere elongation helicase 1 homolog n=1 Tax=Episyrphus balteatus TaxID=286459 RepID=UPI002486ABFE|nr:regulator of telomere elongation helicase 1 homolog [Episyrphus balteatus]